MVVVERWPTEFIIDLGGGAIRAPAAQDKCLVDL